MKPKSIWIIWPSPSNKMLPLCLQHKQYLGHLICKRQFCLERAEIVREKMRSKKKNTSKDGPKIPTKSQKSGILSSKSFHKSKVLSATQNKSQSPVHVEPALCQNTTLKLPKYSNWFMMKINYLQDSEKYQDTASQIGCKSPLRVSYLTTKEKHIIVNC